VPPFIEKLRFTSIGSLPAKCHRVSIALKADSVNQRLPDSDACPTPAPTKISLRKLYFWIDPSRKGTFSAGQANWRQARSPSTLMFHFKTSRTPGLFGEGLATRGKMPRQLWFFGKMRTCPSGFRFARDFPQSRTLEVSRNP